MGLHSAFFEGAPLGQELTALIVGGRSYAVCTSCGHEETAPTDSCSACWKDTLSIVPEGEGHN